MAVLAPSRLVSLEFRFFSRHLLRRWWFWLACAFVAGHAIFSWLYLNRIISYGRGSGTGSFPQGTVFDLQFSLIHIGLYAMPLVLILPVWRRRVEEGFAEQMQLATVGGCRLILSFVLPRVLIFFLFLYAFYATMWPWEDWWLIRFSGDMPQKTWTRWHILVTTNYFITTILFNAGLMMYLALRTPRRAGWWYLVLSVGVDLLVYLAMLCLIPVNTRETFGFQQDWLDRVGEFFSWPMVLLAMLVLNADAWFAPFFYPAKWIAIFLLLRASQRRIEQRVR